MAVVLFSLQEKDKEAAPKVSFIQRLHCRHLHTIFPGGPVLPGDPICPGSPGEPGSPAGPCNTGFTYVQCI